MILLLLFLELKVNLQLSYVNLTPGNLDFGLLLEFFASIVEVFNC